MAIQCPYSDETIRKVKGSVPVATANQHKEITRRMKNETPILLGGDNLKKEVAKFHDMNSKELSVAKNIQDLYSQFWQATVEKYISILEGEADLSNEQAWTVYMMGQSA